MVSPQCELTGSSDIILDILDLFQQREQLYSVNLLVGHQFLGAFEPGLSLRAFKGSLLGVSDFVSQQTG